MLRRYAANRVYITTDGTMLRNGVVEVDDVTHLVVNVFCIDEEIRHTEWLGGLILLSPNSPTRLKDENFVTFLNRIHKKERTSESTSLHAYHITAFDVSSMELTAESRILSL